MIHQLRLIALAAAFAAVAVRSAGEHLEWFTEDDVVAGILLSVWIAGLLVFTVVFGSLWWIGQRLEVQDRRILGDELQTALSRRNAINAFAATFVAAVLISVVPGSEQLPGDASASAIVAIGAATLASTHVASQKEMTRRLKGPATAELLNHMPALRRAEGHTQAQLAAHTQVTRKTINTIERGHYVPSTALALRIAAALGETVEEVFYLAD